MRQWWSKVLSAFGLRRGLHKDLTDEMRSHLEFLIEDNLENGMSAAEARAAAKRRIGNVTLNVEKAEDAWRFPKFETFIQDLRYGLRGIRRSPGFSLVLMLTLALGIGANTAIFSVVYAVLLRPLPYPSSERLVWLGESTAKASGISVTWLNFQHWRSDNRSFEEMAGFATTDLTLTGKEAAVLTHDAVVSDGFFRLTGAEPLFGRTFTADDERPGAPLTAVLSGEYWASTLGGDRNILGNELTLDGKPYQIIGVLRPGLNFFGRPVNIYLPLVPSPASLAKRNQHGSMRVLGLLKPGVTLMQGRADLDAIMRNLAEADPGPEDDHHVFAEYLTVMNTGDVRQTLLVLAAAAALILILACANVASLLLVRGAARAREIAIRAAIGAGRARIVRQLLTESLLLASLGGIIGLALARLCLRALVLAGPTDIPRLREAAVDAPVLIFAAATIVVVGLVAGTAPVLISRKADLTLAMKEGGSGSGASKVGQSFRNTLVVAEVAITLVLMFASGLLVRSLIAAETRDPGFDPSHLLALELQLPHSRYQTGQSIKQFYDGLTATLRIEPGVAAVGSAMCPPSAGDCGDWWYSILGKPQPARGDVPLCLFNTADSAYFQTMRIRLLAGREFTERDVETSPKVAIINEELARKWWDAPQDAVGSHIKWGGPFMDGSVYEIVGVVGSVSQLGLDTAPNPEVFFSFSQQPLPAMVTMVKTSGDSSALIAAVRRDLASIDQNVPIQSLRPMEEWLGAPLKRRRFTTLLLMLFAALAIVLAAVGIFGVLNFWVSLKQREIAVRLALGARPRAILGWAGAHATRLVGIGIVIGLAGGWAASGWLKAMVFGVSPGDPIMFAGACAGVLLIAAMAVSLPLVRAMRVDAVRYLHDA